MPRKGRKNQASPSNGQAPAPGEGTGSSEPLLAAFGIADGELKLALIESSQTVESSQTEIHELLRKAIPINGDSVVEKLKSLVSNLDRCFVVATEQSYPLVKSLENAGLQISILNQALALYYAHHPGREQPEQPCLVLSTNKDQTSCSLIVNGQVANATRERDNLSCLGIWQAYVAGVPHLARTIELKSRKNPTFADSLRDAFVSVWKNGQTATADKYAFSGSVDLQASRASFLELISATDPAGSAQLVLLGEWAAAYCNLAGLLRPSFEVIGDEDPGRALTRPFEGLVRFGRYELALRQRPQLDLSKAKINFGRVVKGKTGHSSFEIQNTGGGLLEAKLIARPRWLEVTPATVTCAKGKPKQTIYLTANTSSLPPGPVQEELEINWSDITGVCSELIPLTIEVASPRTLLAAPIPKPIPHVVDNTRAAPPMIEPAKPIDSQAVPESDALQQSTPLKEPGEELGHSTRDIGRIILFVAAGIMLVGVVVFFLKLWNPAQVPTANSNNPRQTATNSNLSGRPPLIVSNQTPVPGVSMMPTPRPAATVSDNPVTTPLLARPSPGLQAGPVATAEPTISQAEIVRGYYSRASLLRDGGHYDEAIIQCEAGLAVDPNNDLLRSLKTKIEDAKRVLDRPGEVQPNREAKPSSSPTLTNDSYEPPAMVTRVTPVYPAAAREARIAGTVVVAVNLDERGLVLNANAMSGPALLRTAAVEAAKHSTFRPARRGGKPSASSMTVNFNFKLN
jgi:TonB family protein